MAAEPKPSVAALHGAHGAGHAQFSHIDAARLRRGLKRA
jgi:hypothetical protein